MKLASVLLLFAGLASAQTNTLTPQEAADGWVLLFDGTTLFGWTQEGAAQWRAAGGELIADAGDSGWLRSNSAFGDFILRCDFKTGAKPASGVFLRAAKEGEPRMAVPIPPKKSRPAPDRWHSYEVQAAGDHLTVKLDGKKILDGREAGSKFGYFGLQYNKDSAVSFRNIKVKPLGLAPIFDGKSLAGWQVVEPPKPPREKAIWTAENGQIHVLHGSGQLETEGTWDDFILQLDIRCNSTDPKRHPNSGVFVRGDHKGFWTGYESQIRNEYKDDDRAQPVDFGTGAIYGRVAARRIVANDNEFFKMTIDARGPHLAVWVNGYPVTDWEDTRPPSDSARKGARTGAGTISLQAHDPTTNLDFKNIRLVASPKP